MLRTLVLLSIMPRISSIVNATIVVTCCFYFFFATLCIRKKVVVVASRSQKSLRVVRFERVSDLRSNCFVSFRSPECASVCLCVCVRLRVCQSFCDWFWGRKFTGKKN
ncbi:hypothetical protein GQ42DRAFT_41612 [Ramicandelaber brevisporus]|nr:hypothetical protein GQ42DRAFT_41612 [Ramicandelaber brevisporus]